MIRDEFRVHSMAAGKRRRVAAARTPNGVETVRVHPEVWRIALEAAGGDLRRIQVLSGTDVRVTNQAPPELRYGPSRRR